jgi:hypothetical protein
VSISMMFPKSSVVWSGKQIKLIKRSCGRMMRHYGGTYNCHCPVNG